MSSVPYDLGISAARAGALFASALQRSEEPSPHTNAATSKRPREHRRDPWAAVDPDPQPSRTTP